MNKSYIYAGVGVVAVAVIAGIAFYANKSGGPESMYNNPEAVSQMSTKDLLAKSEPQKCTFSHAVGDAESSGTVYVASGRMRGDFTSRAAGQTVESHMIVDGPTVYVWGNQMEQGMKMEFDSMDNAQVEQTGTSVDINQQFNYNCSGWYADQSQFSLPTNISFLDLSAMQAGFGAGAFPTQ